jgi:hypothetical protein
MQEVTSKRREEAGTAFEVFSSAQDIEWYIIWNIEDTPIHSGACPTVAQGE